MKPILFLLAFFSANALADTTLGIGVVAQNMSKTTNNPAASRSLTGTLYQPELSVAYAIGGKSGIGFLPSLGYTVLGKKSPEGGQKKSMLTLAFPAVLTKGKLELKAGPAVIFYQIKGTGGDSVQNNGSSTATFYLPGDTKTSRVFYLDLGIGQTFGLIRADLDAFLTGILGNRFALTGIARLSYVFN